MLLPANAAANGGLCRERWALSQLPYSLPSSVLRPSSLSAITMATRLQSAIIPVRFLTMLGHLLAVVRHRFGPDSLPLYVGARLGPVMTDFQITTSDEDERTNSRSALVLASGFGAELGADPSETLTLTAAYTHHIADYLQTPYGGQIELDIAYDLSESLFLGVGAERIHREMSITKENIQMGVITDTSLGGRVILGLQR